ncbi:MAG: hypothetical protein IIX31_04210, partial [Alistipes sp.]|nr:hypothetical protein [Alistipes sp.]
RIITLSELHPADVDDIRAGDAVCKFGKNARRRPSAKWRLSDGATPQGWRYALGGAIGFVGPSPEKVYSLK